MASGQNLPHEGKRERSSEMKREREIDRETETERELGTHTVQCFPE